MIMTHDNDDNHNDNNTNHTNNNHDDNSIQAVVPDRGRHGQPVRRARHPHRGQEARHCYCY